MRLTLLGILLAAACGGGDGGPSVQSELLGGPNPGLTPEQVAAFEDGKQVFVRRFARSEGHGPHFNTSSCKSCHEIPVAGGSAPLYRNFFIAGNEVQGDFEPAFEDGQIVQRLFSYTRKSRENIPAGTQVVVQRNTPMFGIGLFERLTNTEIIANQDPADNRPLGGDGISGRVNLDGINVGRFGFKAQEGNLEDFVRGPIFNHMGITTDPLSFGASGIPQVSAPDEPTTDDDGVPDPELPFLDLSNLVSFTRHLAPPQPLPMDAAATRGSELFDEIGCAKCHIRNLSPGKLPVDPFTDLLLHDMGSLRDGVIMGVARAEEFRTAPLWGLRHHAPYLHDGRADTIHDAIRLHDGEAEAIRNAYMDLPAGDRADIIAFLETR